MTLIKYINNIENIFLSLYFINNLTNNISFIIFKVSY